MRVVFGLAVVSLIAAALPNLPGDHRKCVTSKDNLPGVHESRYGEDGWRCSNVHPHYGVRRCIQLDWLCNGYDNCGDGEDEGAVCGGFGEDRTCTNPVTGKAVGWRCSNVHPRYGVRRCLPLDWLCNGSDECGDGEDEGEVCGGFREDRTCANPFTGRDGRRCSNLHPRDGVRMCVPLDQLCDGVSWCGDGEDEGIKGFCNFPMLQPGCHFPDDGCHTCAASATIKTSWKYWNGSMEECRKCDPLKHSRYNGTTWKRCNDGFCFNTVVECDSRPDCKDGSDEWNCPWYIGVSATNTLAACFGVVSVSLIGFIVLKKLKWIDTRVENDETPMDTAALVHVDNFVEKLQNSTELDGKFRNIYDNIHKTGQMFNLIISTNIFFSSLTKSQEITTLILGLEQEMHGGRRQALLCLRVNAGSNADIERFLSFEGDPGCIKKTKKKVTQAMDAFLNQSCFQRLVASFPNVKKWSYNISKMLIASVKVTLFLWDLTKDLFLWSILYSKTADLDTSENFLMWLFFTLIFSAQSVVGFYITTEYKTILSIPDDMKTWKKALVLMAMFLLTPCLPSLVIFKATVYATDMAAIVANARQDSSSRPSTVLREMNAIKEKHRLHMQIYAYARVIEATLETLPQVMLLISFVIPNEYGRGLGDILLNKGKLDSPTSILFLVSLPYSLVMIVTAIIGFINTQKRNSLGVLTSSILGMSYVFQLVSTMTSWVITFWLIKTGTDILWSMMILLGTLVATWIFTFVWTSKMVERFAEASMFERFLHVLVNTFVTIPYRDSSDQDQRRKSTEIFWHLAFRSFANVMLVVFGYINLPNDSPLKTDILSILILIISSPCLLLCQLLGGLFMWLFYRKSHWAEINKTGCNFCFCPSTPCVCSPAGLCKMFGCVFLGLFQFIFSLCCCLCCDVWITWCRCFRLDRFNWGGRDILDRDTLAIQELVAVGGGDILDRDTLAIQELVAVGGGDILDRETLAIQELVAVASSEAPNLAQEDTRLPETSDPGMDLHNSSDASTSSLAADDDLPGASPCTPDPSIQVPNLSIQSSNPSLK